MKARRTSRTSSHLTSILLATGSLAALIAVPACGGSGDEGDGDGRATTGGTAGDGDTGSGGDGSGGLGSGGLGAGGDGAGGDGAGGDGAGGDGAGGDGSGGEGTGGDGSGGDGTGGDGSGGEGNGGMPGAAFNCDPPEGTIPALGLEVVESGFDEPVLVTHAGDDRLFVLERAGRILIIENGSTLPTPFLDIENDVESSGQFGEQGLLGLAFHPDYEQNGLLYVYYIQLGGQFGSSRLVEYSVMADDPNQVDTSTERELISVTQPDQNHNGGQLAFGPDGMLYLGLGDGGGSGDQYGNGQDETTLLGALLRIDPTGRDDGAYTVPAGNLSEVLGTAAPEIFSYGLRNPYRYNFDLCTGDLYIGDVGQNAREEVNVTPSGVGQLNYGWSTMEGLSCYSPMSGCDETGLTLPLHDYENDGGAAVTGGTVYRGNEIPAMRGRYVFADSRLNSGRLWHAQYDPSGPSLDDIVDLTGEVGGPGAIVSIQNGPDGEIYMTQYNGSVVKLVSF